MTKVGEGSPAPQEPTVQNYRNDLEKNASKFMNALDHYQDATDVEKRAHFKGVMDQSLALMRSAVREITGDGLRKKEVQVENDYKEYIDSENSDTLSALKQDVSILRDNNDTSL